jgi:hypothetical protein
MGVMVKNAYSDGEIMTRAELSGQVSRDILVYSYYNTAKTRNPFKPRENFYTYPMMKDWLIDRMPVTSLWYVMTVVMPSERVHTTLRQPMHQLLHPEFSRCSKHALLYSNPPLCQCWYIFPLLPIVGTKR